MPERGGEPGSRLGSEIARLRNRKNWTQSDLAISAGLSTSKICKIEKGKCRIDFGDLEVIANALGLTALQLVWEVEKKKHKDPHIIAILENAMIALSG
jgi:transcriptional regulator with XRE-family HTH domain